MTETVGGYKKPSNPYKVSGPGPFSNRTDGKVTEGIVQKETQAPKYMPGLGYGKGGNMDQQSGADIAASNIPKPIALTENTNYPNIPVTDGMPFGPGRGLEAMPSVNRTFSLQETFNQIANNDPTGESEILAQIIANLGIS